MRDEIAAALTGAEGGDRRHLCTLRLVNATIRDRDTARREAGQERLTDAEIGCILAKMAEQREAKAAELDAAGRFDEARATREEVALVRSLMPAPVSLGEMEAACRQAVLETGSKGLRDVGRCMNALKDRYEGKLNLTEASGVVRGLLA